MNHHLSFSVEGSYRVALLTTIELPLSCAPGGVRTRDTWIKSPVLYQLSYGSKLEVLTYASYHASKLSP